MLAAYTAYSVNIGSPMGTSQPGREKTFASRQHRRREVLCHMRWEVHLRHGPAGMARPEKQAHSNVTAHTHMAEWLIERQGAAQKSQQTALQWCCLDPLHLELHSSSIFGEHMLAGGTYVVIVSIGVVHRSSSHGPRSHCVTYDCCGFPSGQA